MIFLLFSLAVFVTELSVDISHSREVLYNRFLKSIVIFILVSNTINNVKELKMFLLTLSLGAFFIAYSITHYPVYSEGRAFINVSTLVADPNDITMLLVYSLPFASVLFLLFDSVISKTVLAYLLFTMILGIVEAQSRGGFLSLVVCFFMLLREIPGLKRKIAAFLLFVILSGPFVYRYVPMEYIWRMQKMTDTSQDVTGSAQARKRNMNMGLEYTFSHLISSYGPGNNGYMIADKVAGLGKHKASVVFFGNHVHNIFLEVGTDIGLIGMIIFILFTGSLYNYCTKAEKLAGKIINKTDSKELILISKALQISFVSFLASAFFLPIAYRIYLYYLGGLCIAVYRVTRTTYNLEQEEIVESKVDTIITLKRDYNNVEIESG